MGRFKRRASGVLLSLDAAEVALLSQVIGEMVEVIGPAPEPIESNEGAEWARELGLDGVGVAAPTVPDNPVTARLFPAAYRDDDEAAADYRRFTGEGLRATKAAHAHHLLGSLPEGGGSITLDDDGCEAWMGALNDARLALGTALDVTEDTPYELETLGEDDPRTQRLLVYLWLGELLESLLFAVSRS